MDSVNCKEEKALEEKRKVERRKGKLAGGPREDGKQETQKERKMKHLQNKFTSADDDDDDDESPSFLCFRFSFCHADKKQVPRGTSDATTLSSLTVS